MGKITTLLMILLMLIGTGAVIIGEEIDYAECQSRLALYASKGLKDSYIMKLDENCYIDATKMGT